MLVDAVMIVYGTELAGGSVAPGVTGGGPSVTVVGNALIEVGQIPAK